MSYSIVKLKQLLPELEAIIDESDKSESEMGTYVCSANNDYIVQSPTRGGFLDINVSDIKECDGRPIALFHTHPTMEKQQEYEGFDDDATEIWVNEHQRKKFSRAAARKNIVPSAMDAVYPLLRETYLDQKRPEMLCIGNKSGLVCYPYRIPPETYEWIRRVLKTSEEKGAGVLLTILSGLGIPQRKRYFGKEIWLRKQVRK